MSNAHAASRREVVFIDAGLKDSYELADSIQSQAEIVTLGSDENGLLQMRSYLLERKDLKAIHLLSHGAPGWVQVGATRFDADAAGSHSDTLRDIAASLCADGEFLIYGCEAGRGAEGEKLLSALLHHAGCRVAANSRPTGNAEMGGNWQLDVGALPVTSTLLNAHSMQSYSGLLAIPADENYNGSANYNAVGNIFTHNGIKYTITGTATYDNLVTNISALSPLGDNGGDYYLFFDQNGSFGITSIKVEAADGSAFRLAAMSFDIMANTTFAITPSGGGSAATFTANGGFITQQDYVFGAGFNNITSFTFSGGNLTAAFDDLDFEPAIIPGPSVSSINRDGSAQTNGSSVSYTVTFSESVTSVDISDFALTTTGSAAGTISAISGSGATYTVTVSSITGDGVMRLDLNSSGTGIQNGASANITGGFTSGQTYAVDHTVPATPAAPAMSSASDSGSLNNDMITNVAAPTFTGTVEANAVVTLYDTDGTTVLGSATANGSGVYSITSSNLAAGSHSITTKAVDAAGNVSSASGASVVNIDFVGPTSMALASTTVDTSAATNGATVTTLSATDANSISYGFAVGNGTIDADNAKFTISGNALVAAQNLSAGTYHIYLRATDAAGNDAFQFFTIEAFDTPAVSSIERAGAASASVLASATTMTYTVTFSQSVTGVEASDFALFTTGSAAGTIASVSGSGATYTVTVNDISGDGAVRLDLNSSGTGIQNGSAIAIAGGYTAGQTYTLDHTVPATPAAPAMSSASDSGSLNNDMITNVAAPTFTGTVEANAVVTLYDTDGTTVLGSATANGSGVYSITSSNLAAGSHSITTKAVDSAGNVSSASGASVVNIDFVGPTSMALASTTVDTSAATNGATVTTLSATDANSISYGFAVGNGTIDADNAKFTISGNALVAAQNLSAGTYHIYLRATDAAGNDAFQIFTITAVDAPAVSSIERAGAASATVLANASTVTYTVTFSQAVTGVDASDFALTSTGSAAGTIASVSGSGTTYTVTVNDISGDGAVRLDLNGSGTGIQNGSAIAIAGGYTAGQTYTLDHTDPATPSAPAISGASDTGSSDSDGYTSNLTPAFAGTGEIGNTVRLYDTDGTTLLGTALVDGDGKWSITSATLANGAHQLTVRATDAAGNISTASSALEVHIDTVAASSINVSSTSVVSSAGPNALVGQLSNNDPGAGSYVYNLIAGAGDANNADFSISGGSLIIHDPALTGTRSIRVSVTDAAGNSFQQVLTLQVANPPPAPTVDGVAVASTSVTLPGGGAGTQVTVPVITSGRQDSSGGTAVADIPLVSGSGATLLLAQLPVGFGLSAIGGPSAPAGSSLEELIRSIIAVTPNHDASDQGHLTGNGATFLQRLPTTVPLLIETIVPVTSGAASNSTLTLTGTSTAQQHTALVIDARQVAPQNSITLNSIDFAAVVGAATIIGNTAGQILTGDGASQEFIVATDLGSAVYAGGGNDILQFGMPALPSGASNQLAESAQAAPALATQSVLHGGQGGDSAIFAGMLSDYTLTTHDGHVVISLNSAPLQQALLVNVETLQFADQAVTVENRTALTSIAGLYQEVLGRQADVAGIDFWGGVERAGMSLGSIALAMIESVEAQSDGGQDAFNGNQAHDIALLYQAIFNRPVEAAGLAYWSESMDHGVSLAEVANDFLHSQEMVGHNLAPAFWDFA